MFVSRCLCITITLTLVYLSCLVYQAVEFRWSVVVSPLYRVSEPAGRPGPGQPNGGPDPGPDHDHRPDHRPYHDHRTEPGPDHDHRADHSPDPGSEAHHTSEPQKFNSSTVPPDHHLHLPQWHHPHHRPVPGPCGGPSCTPPRGSSHTAGQYEYWF